MLFKSCKSTCMPAVCALCLCVCVCMYVFVFRSLNVVSQELSISVDCTFILVNSPAWTMTAASNFQCEYCVFLITGIHCRCDAISLFVRTTSNRITSKKCHKAPQSQKHGTIWRAAKQLSDRTSHIAPLMFPLMFQDVHKLQEKLWPSDHFAVLLSMEVKRWQGQQRKVVGTWHSHISHTSFTHNSHIFTLCSWK